ncbi:uncharacterized protein LOC134254782 [Saccostrea cucullata]|uniref:uncharacterized protein LOC134254782 n=1 Tax=Saccostrea cuccullata TaxID=36930 RepID=UPI002ED2AD8E
MKGNVLQKISTSIGYIQGSHTVTRDEELLYTNGSKNIVYRLSSDMTINKVIQTGSWQPGAIFSSPINEHILVGMKRNTEDKITRYNKEGRKLQDIQWDGKGQELYNSVTYITENINGDICTSDNVTRKEVVVVTASGDYRFSSYGQETQDGFWPFGICTDVMGHILVCNGYNKKCSSVHLMDMDGQFLSFLLTPEQCPPLPRALCIDEKHNLWVGGLHSSTVIVYKYLQETEK